MRQSHTPTFPPYHTQEKHMNPTLRLLLTVFATSAIGLASAETDHKHTEEHHAEESHEQETEEHHAEESHEHEAEEHHAEESHEHEAEAEEHHAEKAHEHEAEEHPVEKAEAHDHGAEGHEETDSAAKLSAKQRALADISIAPLIPKIVDYAIYAPGEIKTNAYNSYLVTPRVDSQVLKRYVILGQHVQQGEALVKLFSTAVAQTQSAYRVAHSEWLRVRQLGKKTVGAKRYVAAKIEYDNHRKTLSLYGLSKAKVKALHRDGGKNLGEYTLYAPTSGIVLADDFHQGQHLIAGAPLIKLADERQLWVEANVSANANIPVQVGAIAKVRVNERTYTATLSQASHAIDPATRTRIIRLIINNEDHSLHAGLFADVFFQLKTDKAVLTVPDAALMRDAHGDWTVFVETEPGQYQPQEIQIVRRLGKQHEITGISPNTRIVMKGAFFVASEIAKGGFDPHNH